MPDNQDDLNGRIKRFERLIKQIDILFSIDIDIVIIAQNWKNFSIDNITKHKVLQYNYDKLGILKARHTLREKFLENNYDYIIMFDDDAIIYGNNNKIKEYLDLMEKNPNGFCFIKGTDPNGYINSQLNLCAISKYIYEKEPIPNIDPQKSEGFEDRIFSCLLHNKYSQYEFNEPVGLKCIHFKNPEINKFGGEVSSTWAKEKQYNWTHMRNNTAEIESYIKKYKELPNLDIFLAKNMNVDYQGYNFIQLGGNCSGLGYLGSNRLRGPVDNVVTKNYKCLEYLLNNTYIEKLKTDECKVYDKKPSYIGDQTIGYFYDFVEIIHNKMDTDDFWNELKIRVNNFNSFNAVINKYKNYYFTYNLNAWDIDNKTHLLIGNNLKLKLNLLSQLGVLNKTIFIITRSVGGGSWADWWSDDAVKLLDLYKAKYVEIINNNIHSGKDITCQQFINKVKQILNDKTEDKIDLVVPYVDSNDTNWIKLFNIYNPYKDQSIEAINAKNRFRGQGDFFKYFFRCIDTNMPWINNLFLIVQSESQVPEWLDKTKIKIITHDKFIPKEYLPTFNSCTIEMFLHNIPNLSEKFIYFNDDIFVLNHLNSSDIFSGDKVLFNYSEKEKLSDLLYSKHIINANNLIFKNVVTYKYYEHAFRPFLKSEMSECFNRNKIDILNSISTFRQEKNINCYVWLNDLIQKNKQQKSTIIQGTLQSNSSDKLIKERLNSRDSICINDTNEDINIYENKELKIWFSNNFPYASKYEIDYDEKKKNKFRQKINNTNSVVSNLTYTNPPQKKTIRIDSSIAFTGLPEIYIEDDLGDNSHLVRVKKGDTSKPFNGFKR